MSYVIYLESRMHSKWVVLVTETKTFQDGSANGQEQSYYRRFAESGSYDDALAIVRAMSVTVPQ